MTQPAVPTAYAVHQPNFMPWLGYFVKIAASDAFIFLDDAQMPGGSSYVHRVRIRKGQESGWLSVPVTRTFGQSINEIPVALGPWRDKHFNVLRDRYGHEPGFDELLSVIEPAYAAGHPGLADFNLDLLGRLCAWLGIATPVRCSSSFAIAETSDRRLAKLGQAIGARLYLSGQGGQKYQDEQTFAAHGINLAVTNVGATWHRLGVPPEINSGHSVFEVGAILGRETTARLVQQLASLIATEERQACPIQD